MFSLTDKDEGYASLSSAGSARYARLYCGWLAPGLHFTGPGRLSDALTIIELGLNTLTLAWPLASATYTTASSWNLEPTLSWT